MSYPLDLDEMSMNDLRDEIDRREKLFANNNCPYCSRSLKACSKQPCKMSNRMVEYMGKEQK